MCSILVVAGTLSVSYQKTLEPQTKQVPSGVVFWHSFSITKKVAL